MNQMTRHTGNKALTFSIFFIVGCKTLDAFLTKNVQGKSTRPVHSTVTSLTPQNKSLSASLFEDNKLDKVGFSDYAEK